jgi:hypothetical protein
MEHSILVVSNVPEEAAYIYGIVLRAQVDLLPIWEEGSAETLGPAIFHLIDRARLRVSSLEESFSFDHTI